MKIKQEIMRDIGIKKNFALKNFKLISSTMRYSIVVSTKIEDQLSPRYLEETQNSAELLSRQIMLHIQGIVTLQKVSTVGRSRLSKRCCTSPARQLEQRLLPLNAIVTRPSENDCNHLSTKKRQ